MAGAELDELAFKVIRIRDQARADRGPWDTEWQEIGDFVVQRKNSITIEQSKGNTRTTRIFDTTAGDALQEYVMGIWTFMFQGRWIRLEADEKEIKDIDVVQRFWGDVADIILQHLGQSNFNLQSVEMLEDHGGFGTACMLVEEGVNTLYNFKTFPIGGFYIIENNQGAPDTILFDFEFTARQAVEQWGEDKVHPEIKTDFALQKSLAQGNNRTAEKTYKFVQIVSPRDHFDVNKIDKLNKPISTVIVDETNKVVVEEGGFDEMPIMCPRFQKSNTERYGRAPAKRKMPVIRMAGRIERTVLKGLEKSVDPPTLMPHSSANNYPLSTDPGGIIYWDGKNPANKPEAWHINPNIIDTENKLVLIRADIRKAFFADMFDALGDRKNMTATEIIERVKKQIILFIPIFGRIVQEWLNPLVERLIGIAFRAGLLPPVPEEVAFSPNFNVIFNNKITTLIKLLENESFTLTMELLQPWMVAFPQIAENFDWDEIARETSMNFNLPTKFLIKPEVRDEKRAAELEAAQQAAQLEGLEKLASTAGKT